MKERNVVEHAADVAPAGPERLHESASMPRSPGPKGIFRLQRTLGNSATLTILRQAGYEMGGRAGEAGFEVSQPGDRYEMEAENVAESVMRSVNGMQSSSQETTRSKSLTISRMSASSAPVQAHRCACEHSGTPCAACAKKALQRSEGTEAEGASGDRAQSSVHQVLGSTGHSLDAGMRSLMEPRFGRDFSGVRIHTDAQAADSAAEVNARAYVVGQHVVFGRGEYAPQSEAGQRLLAHELTHTVQQREVNPFLVNRVTLSRQQSGQQGQAAAQSENVTAGSAWNNCTSERPSTGRGAHARHAANLRLPGYNASTTGPHISAITVTIHANRESVVSLAWQNVPSGSHVPSTLRASPGAGLCSTDCSNVHDSQVSGSCCTPLSPPTYHVQGYDCHLHGHRRATFVTWFKHDRDIAFHYLGIPSHPHSHGCVRLDRSERGAEWIHDNSIASVTSVTVNRNASEGPGPVCYQHLSDEEPTARPQPQHGHGHSTGTHGRHRSHP
jgi:hypothetical protein